MKNERKMKKVKKYVLFQIIDKVQVYNTIFSPLRRCSYKAKTKEKIIFIPNFTMEPSQPTTDKKNDEKKKPTKSNHLVKFKGSSVWSQDLSEGENLVLCSLMWKACGKQHNLELTAIIKDNFSLFSLQFKKLCVLNLRLQVWVNFKALCFALLPPFYQLI